MVSSLIHTTCSNAINNSVGRRSYLAARHAGFTTGAKVLDREHVVWGTAVDLQGGYATRSGYIGQLLFTTFLRGHFDSLAPRPIDGNKRRFPRSPVSQILSLKPELFTVDSSRRPSRAARARARAPRARSACTFQNNNFRKNSEVFPLYMC